MATNAVQNHVREEGEGGEENEEAKQKKGHDKAANVDLERITDYAEDTEVANKDIVNAVSLIEGRRSEEQEQKTAREKHLASVKIKKEDIELIVREMEVSTSAAERCLRESEGDVVAALISLTN